MANTSSWRRLLLIAALLIFTACAAKATPTPTLLALTPTDTSQYSTVSGPIIRATLPPTWTLTFTPLPTLTASPTPVTPTETLTPVPDLSDLCDSLTISNPIPDGQTYGWNDVITLIFGTSISAVRDPNTLKVVTLEVRFLATNTDNKQNLGVQLAGGQGLAVELPVHQLPGPGAYTWKISVYGDGIGDQCVHQGTFSVTQTANDLLTATAISATEASDLLTTTAISATQTSVQATQDASASTDMPIFEQ